jgi:hypothetical protein
VSKQTQLCRSYARILTTEQQAVFQNLDPRLRHLPARTSCTETLVGNFRRLPSHAYHTVVRQQFQPLDDHQTVLQPRYPISAQVLAIGRPWSSSAQSAVQAKRPAIASAPRVACPQTTEPDSHTSAEWRTHTIGIFEERHWCATTFRESCSSPGSTRNPKATDPWATATVLEEQLAAWSA